MMPATDSLGTSQRKDTMDTTTPPAARKAASLFWIYPVSFALSLLIMSTCPVLWLF